MVAWLRSCYYYYCAVLKVVCATVLAAHAIGQCGHENKIDKEFDEGRGKE